MLRTQLQVIMYTVLAKCLNLTAKVNYGFISSGQGHGEAYDLKGQTQAACNRILVNE